ncbi:unnamed protein product [Peniophora sp. CBMAI 1063]|nr:unnamed protein product [Peniophora sp. CBMAI 1063]
MDNYTRAVARVSAALRALKRAPESLQVAYAKDFVVEIWKARTMRRERNLPRSSFILALTQMVARCKQPAGPDTVLDVKCFVEEIRAFDMPPKEEFYQDLGDDQWWLALPMREAMSNTCPVPPVAKDVFSTLIHTSETSLLNGSRASIDGRTVGKRREEVPATDSEVIRANKRSAPDFNAHMVDGLPKPDPAEEPEGMVFRQDCSIELTPSRQPFPGFNQEQLDRAARTSFGWRLHMPFLCTDRRTVPRFRQPFRLSESILVNY